MRWALLIAGLLAAGCGGPTSAADFGEELFQDSRLSESDFNSFSCATCHATTATTKPGLIHSGYSLYNSAFRPSWWGGFETDLLDSVNFCYVNFMRGISPLTPEEPKSRALYEYLVQISPDRQAPPLPFTVVKDIQDVPRGDTSRGAEVYRAACQTCHGEAHTGKERLTQLAPILPEITDSYGQVFPGVPKQLVVIEKVRHGQFFGVSGSMPLYSREALSDADLGALLGFLGF